MMSSHRRAKLDPHEAGRQLRDLREARDLSIADLAAAAGCSQRTIQRLEAGQQVAGLKTRQRLAGALGLPLWTHHATPITWPDDIPAAGGTWEAALGGVQGADWLGGTWEASLGGVQGADWLGGARQGPAWKLMELPVGERIRFCRELHGISAEELAKRAGCSLRTVRRLEAGGAPSERIANALAEALHLPTALLARHPVGPDEAQDQSRAERPLIPFARFEPVEPQSPDNPPKDSRGIARFITNLDLLDVLLEDLWGQHEITLADAERAPETPGVYVVCERSQPFYVGETLDLRHRLHIHREPDWASAPWGPDTAESFFPEIAQREAEAIGAAHLYALKGKPEFRAVWETARRRVANMAVRFLGLSDPVQRSMLTLYASLALRSADERGFRRFPEG